jgi:hypothetical protein
VTASGLPATAGSGDSVTVEGVIGPAPARVAWRGGVSAAPRAPRRGAKKRAARGTPHDFHVSALAIGADASASASSTAARSSAIAQGGEASGRAESAAC